MGKTRRIVEMARQEGELWPWRAIVDESAVPALMTQPDAAYYVSTFTLLVPEEQDLKDIPRLFETATKAGDLFFDFDSKDLTKAKEDADSVSAYLTSSLGVPPEAMRLYESGGKGYHLMVAQAATGLTPRADLHILYGKLAKSLAGVGKHGTLDTKIYNARRMFRVPGSKHQKTGRVKVLLSGPATWPLSLETSPLLNQSFLNTEVKSAEVLKSRRRIPAEFFYDPLDCIKQVMEVGVGEGSRNDTCFTVALYWKALGLAQRAIESKLMASALHTSAGVDKQEIMATVTSACKGDLQFGLKDSILEPFITDRDRERWKKNKIDEEYETFSELIERYLEELEHPRRTVGQ